MLFDSAERQRYIEQMVGGLKLVLENVSPKLENQENFHEFCRLLSRIKQNYQVQELVRASVWWSFIILCIILAQYGWILLLGGPKSL